MITYTNIVAHDKLDFGEYLKLPGFSHSFLKREKMGVSPHMEMTDNIRVGALVDAILTEPEKADMFSELYPQAKAIAAYLKMVFDIPSCKMQMSYTGDINYDSFVMPVTGRLDLLVPNSSVVDIKVTASSIKDLPTLIEFMGYKNQLWNYCKLAQVNDAYLLFYSKKDRKTALIHVDCSSNSNEFWEEKTIKFGRVKS